MFGDYGAAAMKQAGNRLTGKAEGNLSVQDKIAKDKFISDFIGRASTNLNSAIQSGLVDPNIKAGAPGAVEPQQDATPDATTDQQPSTPQQPATSAAPKTPAEIQKEKLAAAAKVAQDQMANNPAPAPGGPKTPEQIRKEKQAAAGQVAQQQMAANPAPAPGGPTQSTQPAGQQAPAAPSAANKKAMKNQYKADVAAATAAKAKPSFQQDAMDKLAQKKVNVGDGPKINAYGKQYEELESKYAKLDNILESIINIDEAEEAQSISEYLQNMFNQYLGIPITDPKAKAQVKTLADMAQASYPRMKDALTKMANLGFAISYSQGTGATQGASATTSQPASALDAIKAGVQQGMGSDASASTSTSASPTTATTPGTPEQGTTAYDQVMALVDKLSTEEKQKLIATLQEPASGGQGAFDQMKNQLREPKTTANPVTDRQQKLNTNKVKAGNKGAPTTAEYDKFDKLAQQALAKQV